MNTNLTPPTLDDERIAAMRSGVMQAVDQRVRDRGRVVRKAIGGTLAVALVLGVGGAGVSMLVRPSGEPVISATDFGGNDSAGAMDERASIPEVAMDPREDSAYAADGDTASSPSGELIESAAAREVITTGSIDLVVKSPQDSAARLTTWVEGVGGRIDSRYDDGELMTTLTLRLPADKVSSALSELDEYGEVTQTSIDRQDVTASARDLDARIGALTTSTERLERIMANADTSEELIAAERALTERQEQLESLQSQRAQLKDQVALSTLTVSLMQRERAESVEPGGFLGGLRDGWNALAATVNAVVTAAGAALPWLAVLAAVALVWRLVSRRRRIKV